MDKFANFTKRSKITKTIGFGLEPVDKTAEYQKAYNDFEFDKQSNEKISSVIPIIDSVVIDIMSKSIPNIDFDFATFDPDTKGKELDKIYKILSAPVSDAFNELMQEACKGNKKIKNVYKISDINSAEFVQNVLPLYTDDEELIKEFKGNNDRLRGILKSRENALLLSMPKRILENLTRYKENIKIIEKLINSKISGTIYDLYPKIDKLTDINNYKDYISPAGINEYNTVMNGMVSEDKIVKKGLIMLVNESNNSSKSSLPKPKELYKQVLFPRDKAFTIESITSDDEAFNAIVKAIDNATTSGSDILKLLGKVTEDGLVVKYNRLASLSYKLLGDVLIMPSLVRDYRTKDLKEEYDNATTAKGRKSVLRKLNNREDEIKKEQYPLSQIFKLCKNSEEPIENISFCNIDTIRAYASTMYMEAKALSEAVKKDIENGSVSKLKGTDNEKLRIKEMFDAWVDFRDYIMLFMRNDIDLGDNIYYNGFFESLPGLTHITKLKALVNSYVTKKPGDIVKNEVSLSRHPRRTTIDWIQPENKEDPSDPASKLQLNTCFLYKKDGDYYYVQGTPGIERTNVYGNGDGIIFSLKKFGNPTTQLPKLVFSNKVKEEFNNSNVDEVVVTANMSTPLIITRKAFNIYTDGTYKKDALKKVLVTEDEYRKNLAVLLTLYKDFLNSYTRAAGYKDNIHYRPIEEYRDSSEFFDDVSSGAYYKTQERANDKLIAKLVNEGKAYMFRLVSKGFTYKKTDNENILIEALENNTSDVILLTNPKLTWRDAVIEKRVTHKKGDILVNRRDKDGYPIPENIYSELKAYYGDRSTMADISDEARDYIRNNKVGFKKSPIDLIKDKRYTEMQQEIKITYTKNISASNVKESVSSKINKTKNDMNILAITRSMNDLIYVTVTSPDGKILESKSLNVINKLDWHKKLMEISETRRSRKANDWDNSDTCKNERDAYMANAISIIVRMVIDYNAIVVIEKIFDEAKNEYSAFDGQVFKKFEQKLVNRLSDLHFRDIPLGEPGSLTNPYQLCDNNGNEFHDGIVYYATTPYTFGVDLDTGFANVFDLSKINTRYDRQNFLSKFEQIRYDKNKNRFVFEFDYDKFITKKDIKKTKWTVLAGGPEVKFNREHKYNTYIEETASQVYAELTKHGYGGEDLSKLALESKLTAEEVNMLYNIFIKAVRGSLGAHDGIRKQYISPVTGKSYDYAEYGTLTLIEKYKWTQRDVKDRGEWIDNIKR